MIIFFLPRDRQAREILAIRSCQTLGLLNPPLEPPGCTPQGQFGVDVQLAGQIDGSEQHVAYLVIGCRLRAPAFLPWLGVLLGLQSFQQLADLLVDLFEDGLMALPVEADGGRPQLYPLSIKGRWQIPGNIVEDTLAALLLALDALPAPDNLRRIFDLSAGEDMGMSPDQLLGDGTGDGAQVTPAVLLGYE